MKRYKIKVSYLGKNYLGWQSQRNNKTVQEHVESALRTFLRHEVALLGASRTDSGVHARGQVASFTTEHELQADKFLMGMRAILPHDISIMDIEEVNMDFHPTLDAKRKCYRYQLYLNSRVIDPFVRDYVWHVAPHFNLELFKQTILMFKGRHNFKSFCAADSSAKTFEREILSIDFEQEDQVFKIYFVGTGFLKQMIRNIVGTCYDVAMRKFDASELPYILQAQDRRQAGRTAPAQGLCLWEVFYD